MIQHVTLEVRPEDVEACVQFWARLGFDEVTPPASLRGRARWVQARGTQVHLLPTAEPVIPPAGHVAVIAEDFDATLARLHAAGVDVDERAAHWGARRVFARCPAGHRVEVMAAPPP